MSIPPERLAGFFHHGRDLHIIPHVARLDKPGTKGFGERPDAFFQNRAGVRKPEPRALPGECLGDPPGDAVIVGHTKNERGFSG